MVLSQKRDLQSQLENHGPVLQLVLVQKTHCTTAQQQILTYRYRRMDLRLDQPRKHQS